MILFCLLLNIFLSSICNSCVLFAPDTWFLGSAILQQQIKHQRKTKKDFNSINQTVQISHEGLVNNLLIMFELRLHLLCCTIQPVCPKLHRLPYSMVGKDRLRSKQSHSEIRQNQLYQRCYRKIIKTNNLSDYLTSKRATYCFCFISKMKITE